MTWSTSRARHWDIGRRLDVDALDPFGHGRGDDLVPGRFRATRPIRFMRCLRFGVEDRDDRLILLVGGRNVTSLIGVDSYRSPLAV